MHGQLNVEVLYTWSQDMTFVLTIRIIRHVKWWKLTSKRVVGTLSQRPGQHLAREPKDIKKKKKKKKKNSWEQHDSIHLAPLTMHNYRCICGNATLKRNSFLYLSIPANPATIVFLTLTAIACFILMSFHSNANYTFHGTKNGVGNTVRVQ